VVLLFKKLFALLWALQEEIAAGRSEDLGTILCRMIQDALSAKI